MDYQYDAVVKKVHDGDTLTVDLDFGLDEWRHNFVVRLFGINAPELNTDAGKAARDYLEACLPPGTKVVLETVKDKPDKYGGRYLGVVLLQPSGLVINKLLVAQGHAKEWDGKGTKP